MRQQWKKSLAMPLGGINIISPKKRFRKSSGLYLFLTTQLLIPIRSWALALFVEKQLLFSSNSELFSKYLSEGPTTNGFPAESPGNIGTFVGWQIIKAYMKENPEISPARLMKETDATIILKDSKYKPKK